MVLLPAALLGMFEKAGRQALAVDVDMQTSQACSLHSLGLVQGSGGAIWGVKSLLEDLAADLE
jgi:hypothetical protein